MQRDRDKALTRGKKKLDGIHLMFLLILNKS